MKQRIITGACFYNRTPVLFAVLVLIFAHDKFRGDFIGYNTHMESFLL